MNNFSNKVRQCPGCHATFFQREDLILPDFGMIRYGVASPECQLVFNEILSKERVNYGYPSVHRLIVDSYGVQHPPHLDYQCQLGIDSRFIEASKQSVVIHLIALYAAIEGKKELSLIAPIMDKILTALNRQGKNLQALTAPKDLGIIKAIDINKNINEKTTLKEYTEFAWQWAHSAWDAWKENHETIKKLYNDFA